MLTINIGRAGAHISALLEDGATVQDALTKTSLTVGSEERIYNQNAVLMGAGDRLENGTYTISKQQENGCQ